MPTDNLTQCKISLRNDNLVIERDSRTGNRQRRFTYALSMIWCIKKVFAGESYCLTNNRRSRSSLQIILRNEESFIVFFDNDVALQEFYAHNRSRQGDDSSDFLS